MVPLLIGFTRAGRTTPKADSCQDRSHRRSRWRRAEPAATDWPRP